MFRALRLRQEPVPVIPESKPVTIEQWLGDAQYPLSIRTINALAQDAKQRLYRTLVPPELLGRLGINPILWRGSGYRLELRAAPESSTVNLTINNPADENDP